MQISAKATKMCPMCSEINHIEVGQVGFVCARCGYTDGLKQPPKVSAFKRTKKPKGIGKEF
jgi:ribosomal protein S27AE